MSAIRKLDLNDAIIQLGMMKFFPADEKTRSAISVELAKMCPHLEALEWLIATLVANCPDWPGIAEVRALLCTRYDPADGKQSKLSCTVPGFTPADAEARYIEQAEARKSLDGDGTALKQITGEVDFSLTGPRKVISTSKRVSRPRNPEFEEMLERLDGGR